jgi:hypothetical protein
VAVAFGVLGATVGAEAAGFGAAVVFGAVAAFGAAVAFGAPGAAVVLGCAALGVAVLEGAGVLRGPAEAVGVQSGRCHQPSAAFFFPELWNRCSPPARCSQPTRCPSLSGQSPQAMAMDGTPTAPMATTATTIRR